MLTICDSNSVQGLQKPLIFETQKQGLPCPLLHVTANHHKYPGGIRERSPRLRLRSGTGSPPARSAVPIFYVSPMYRRPITHHRSGLTGPKSAIFTASGIATVLLYVVRVNR